MLKGDLQLERLENFSDTSFPLFKRVTNLLFPIQADFLLKYVRLKNMPSFYTPYTT